MQNSRGSLDQWVTTFDLTVYSFRQLTHGETIANHGAYNKLLTDLPSNLEVDLLQSVKARVKKTSQCRHNSPSFAGIQSSSVRNTTVCKGVFHVALTIT